MIYKRKTMLRTEWWGIEKRSFCDMPVENEWLKGRAGLLRMDRVEQPFFVDLFERRMQITGEGYTWLQLAPEKGHYWATVMFDDKGTLFEYYFDITYENHVLENGQSWFYDLILDVLMAPGGKMTRLDNRELDEALQAGKIDKNIYDMAVCEQEKLMEMLNGHEKEFSEMCCELRKKLYERLKG